MPSTVTIEIPAASEALVRQLLAFHEELQSLALSAPHGTVLDTCEEAVLVQGRELQTRMLRQAIAHRVADAEKKGPRSAAASAVGPRTTRARTRVSSSPPSGS
jgi:hypothetical protein